MKTREQNENNKRREIKRFDWFIERIQTRVAFGWLSERSGEKLPLELSRNQSKLYFDVILQHGWPIEQCLLHIWVFFGGKTKRFFNVIRKSLYDKYSLAVAFNKAIWVIV